MNDLYGKGWQTVVECFSSVNRGQEVIMVNWKSPEEAEAWWNELQELKKKVNEVEKRLIDSAKNEINTSIASLIGILPHDKRRYLNKRRQHYAELIRKSKDEKEAFNPSEQFLEEVLTYLNSS